MKNLTKLLLGAASLAAVCSVAAPAFAQDACPPMGADRQRRRASDYRFRGISQNDRNPSRRRAR